MKPKTKIGRRTISLILATMLMWPCVVSSQHNLTLYSSGRIPQRIYLNPAFIPEQNGYVGVPFLSGVHMGIANPFSYNNVLTRDASDSLNFEANHMLDKVSKNDHFSLFTNFDILSVGSKISKGRFYINVGIRERISQNMYLPENMFNLLWYGNAAPQFFGQRINLAPTMNASVYDELSFTFAGYALKNKLTYGVTLKYLSGRVNITTKKSSFNFYTDTTNYNLMMSSDFEVQTSGISDMSSAQSVFPGNNGFAIDFGATCQIDDHFSISASVLDLGFINWKANTLTFVSEQPGKEFTYSGMSIHDFISVFTDFEKFTTSVFDSLVRDIHVDSVYNVKYRSNLPAVFNLGGSYAPDDRNRINVVLNGISWNHYFNPAFSLSYEFSWTKHVGLSLSYNIFNRQYTNVGGGINVTAGAMQLYFVSDNIPGLIMYKSTNNASFQFGINILLRGKSAKTVTPDIVAPVAPVQQIPTTSGQ
jgi:hypothetical protein